MPLKKVNIFLYDKAIMILVCIGSIRVEERGVGTMNVTGVYRMTRLIGGATGAAELLAEPEKI